MTRPRKQFSDPAQQAIHLKKLEREREVAYLKRLGSWDRPIKSIEEKRKYNREWAHNKKLKLKAENAVPIPNKRTIESEIKLIDEIIEWLAYNSPFDQEYTNKLSDLSIVENRLNNLIKQQ